MIDAKLSVAYRFNPPGIDAGGEGRVLDQVVIQRPFLHDLPAGKVEENGIVLHAAKLGGADQAVGGTGKRCTNYQNVGRFQELIQPLRRPNRIRLLICPTMPVDGVYLHADAAHQPGGRSSNAPKAEDSANPAREHAVSLELIKLATFEVFVFQDQALGGGKGHGERVLSHRLGIAATVGCHWHALRQLAQPNKVYASNHELDQPRADQQLRGRTAVLWRC